MSYEADEKSVVIFADAEDDNATVSINGNYESLSSLEVNKIEIEVTAEDDSKKTYTLNITKNQGISDTKLILKINDITVNFDDDNYYKTIELYYVDKVVFDYSLSNSDSTLKIYKNDEELTSSEDYIDVGDHKYKFVITDSNGDKVEYNVEIEKEGVLVSIFTIIAAGAFFVGCGLVIKKIFSKVRGRDRK